MNSRVHNLKTHPEPFQALVDGVKNYEIRRQDRDFRVGDTLILQEYDPTGPGYTGRDRTRVVVYISAGGTWGLPPDLCVLGLGLFPPVPEPGAPIPMRLRCPSCGELHVDEGEFATKPHHTHACQNCGEVWRPAVVPTVGVRFLPGFKNAEMDGK